MILQTSKAKTAGDLTGTAAVPGLRLIVQLWSNFALSYG